MNDNDPLAFVSIQSAPERSAGGGAGACPTKVGLENDARPDPPPTRPPEPDATDCCGEGCVRCVYDRYDEALERYQLAFAAWQVRHP